MAASALRRLLLCTLLLSSALARHVVELTPSNFDALVNAGDSDWLVEVYAPWCGHCKRMEPQYERAAEQLAGGRMRLGRIDGARWRSLTLRFGVGGFPSFFHVEGATGAVRSALLSAHTSEAIVKFAAKDQSGVKPIPVWTSPNGPVKRFLFAGMTYGEACAWRGGEASALECARECAGVGMRRGELWSGNEAGAGQRRRAALQCGCFCAARLALVQGSTLPSSVCAAQCVSPSPHCSLHCASAPTPHPPHSNPPARAHRGLPRRAQAAHLVRLLPRGTRAADAHHDFDGSRNGAKQASKGGEAARGVRGLD